MPNLTKRILQNSERNSLLTIFSQRQKKSLTNISNVAVALSFRETSILQIFAKQIFADHGNVCYVAIVQKKVVILFACSQFNWNSVLL